MSGASTILNFLIIRMKRQSTTCVRAPIWVRVNTCGSGVFMNGHVFLSLEELAGNSCMCAGNALYSAVVVSSECVL